MALIFADMATLKLCLYHLFAILVAIFALEASILALVSTFHFSLAVFDTLYRIMASGIIPCHCKVVAEAITAMATAHSKSTNLFAATLWHIIEIFGLLYNGFVIMVLTFEDQLLIYFFSLIENLDHFEPNMLLSISFFVFFLVFLCGITKTLGVSENVETQNGSGKGYTHSVACFQEPNLIHMVISY